jgi:hypothetical protein
MNSNNKTHLWSQATLPEVFRSIGTVSILIAALSFLLFGSSSTADAARYTYLLLFTGLVALSGLGAQRLLRDAAAARNLLAITAALLPVHACILGAFLVSSGGSGDFSSYPKALIWQVGSFREALTFVILGFPLLSLFSSLAFAVLQRERAKLYSLCYAGGNILLLLPLRSTFVSLCCFLAALSLAFFSIKDSAQGSFADKTRESLICKALIFSPAISIAVRSLFGAENFYLMLGISLFLIAYFFYRASLEFGGLLKNFLYALSSLAQFFAALYISIEVHDELIPESYRSYSLLFFFSLLACSNVLYILDRSVDKGAVLLRALYCFSFGTCIQFLVSMNVLSALLLVLTGTLFIALDWVQSNKGHKVIGVIQLAAGMLFNIQLTVSHAFQLNSWLGFSLLGLVMILSSNALGRFAHRAFGSKSGNSPEVASLDVA